MAMSRWISVMVVGALAAGADAQPAPAVEAAAPVELTAPRADSLSGRLFLADTAVLTPAAATRVTWRLFELGFRHGVTERLELMAGAMVAPGDDGSVGGYGQLKLGVLQRPRLAAALTLGVGVGPSGSHELFGVGGAAITACLDRQCWVLVNAGAHLTQTADGLGPIALGGGLSVGQRARLVVEYQRALRRPSDWSIELPQDVSYLGGRYRRSFWQLDLGVGAIGRDEMCIVADPGCAERSTVLVPLGAASFAL
jgi:hypothetical protein